MKTRTKLTYCIGFLSVVGLSACKQQPEPTVPGRDSGKVEPYTSSVEDSGYVNGSLRNQPDTMGEEAAQEATQPQDAETGTGGVTREGTPGTAGAEPPPPDSTSRRAPNGETRSTQGGGVPGETQIGDTVTGDQPTPSAQAEAIELDRLNPDEVKQLQTALNAQGNKLAVDGIVGPETRTALENWQQENGISDTGMVTEETLSGLGLPTTMFAH